MATTTTTTGESLASLETQTLLTKTKAGKETLGRLKQIVPPALYKVYLLILINGTSAVGSTSVYINAAGVVGSIKIDADHHFRAVVCMANDPSWKLFKTESKAGKDGAFELAGSQGVTSVMNSKRLNNNPITGPDRNSSSLAEYALNKIHPKFTEELEKYCMLIKTRAYLAIPASAFGAIQQVVSYMNGIVGAFQKAIFSVYRGVIKLIQQFYAYINGIIKKIQNMLMDLIEQIIPLDLICMILEAVQVILDDINFFTSLFGQSGSMFNFLNTFQGYINQVSTLISNPLSTLNAYIPADINNIIQMVEQIGSDPNGFLTDQLSNYGFAWALNAIQGDVLGAVINKYGAQYAAIGPVSQLLNSGEGYARNMGSTAQTPATIKPDINRYSGVNRDENKNIFPFINKIDFADLLKSP